MIAKILKKVDQYKTEDSTLTNGVKYGYKVGYWERTDTWSAVRWPITASASRKEWGNYQ